MTTVFGSLDVGAALGLVLCGPLIRAAGWPSVFYLFAAIGLLWCLLWPLLNPEKAGDVKGAPAAAHAPVLAPRSDDAGVGHRALLVSGLRAEA